MSLPVHALVDTDSLKAYQKQRGDGNADLLETAIDLASAAIARACHGSLVYTGEASVGYFDVPYPGDEELGSDLLQLRDTPVLQIVEVAAATSIAPTWTGQALSDSTYVVNRKTGILQSVSALSGNFWTPGPRSIRVTYKAGFKGPKTPVPTSPDVLPANIEPVDPELRRIALAVSARVVLTVTEGLHGINSRSDSLGNFTKVDSIDLTDAELEALRRGGYIRNYVGFPVEIRA